MAWSVGVLVCTGGVPDLEAWYAWPMTLLMWLVIAPFAALLGLLMLSLIGACIKGDRPESNGDV